MKKETVIAIILGITLGSVIAIALIFSARTKDINGKKVINTKVSPTIVNLTSSTPQFEVTDPKNNTSISKDTLSIKGKTQKDSLIIIQSKNAEKAVNIDTDSFSIDFPLSFGENVLRITNYNGTTISDKVLTVYRIQE